MFVITLKFGDNKDQASRLMDAHNEWIKRGFDEGVFLLVGSLQPNQGGAIVAVGDDLQSLEARVSEDPFVQEGVVVSDIMEISPARVDDRLSFLSS